MAKFYLKNCVVTVDGVDVSDHVTSVTVNLTKDEIETTNFSGGGRERMHGLKDDSFEVNFQQDFAASSIDELLFDLYNTEAEFPVVVRPTNAAVGAANPSFSGTCILLEYQPIAGDVGSLSETSVTFPSQRTGITRATA